MEPTINGFKEWINLHTIKAVSGKAFVTTESLRHWLQSETGGGDAAKTIFDSLLKAPLPTTPDDELKSLAFSNSDLLLCILLQLDKGHHFPDLRKLGISNQSLPISKQDLHTLAKVLEENETSFAVDFFEAQWLFCSVVFELEGCYEVYTETPIPIYSQKLIAEGRTAKVYEVAIPEEFVGPKLRSVASAARYKDFDISDDWSYRFVLKSFRKQDLDLGKRETNISRDLKGIDRFVRPLVTFTIGKTSDSQSATSQPDTNHSYNILFECGEMDLVDYFASKHPPVTPLAIKSFWMNISRLVEALHQLHEVSELNTRSDIGKELIGYHHDIKPSNVIIVHGQFKLSDFGFAAIREVSREQIPSSAAYGTVSYGPPEPNIYTTNPAPESLQKFDLWSLGCVLSEAATWVILGQPGVERFQTLRRRHLDRLCDEYDQRDRSDTPEPRAGKIRRGDYFHDGKNVLKVVSAWHYLLRYTSRRSDPFTVKIIDIIDQSLLVSDISKRVDAGFLFGLMNDVLEDHVAGPDFGFPIDQELSDVLRDLETEDEKDEAI